MNHFTADDGEQIKVEVSGNGPALVLLHGWTSGHRDWSMFMPGLNQSFRVYRWDARCRGDYQPLTQTAPTVTRMARDLRKLLEHFELEDALIVGHSMGALTLWQYLQDFGTDRVRKLCFIDQSPKLVTDADWQLGVYGDFDHAHSRQFIERLHQDFADTVLKLVAHGLNRRARADFEAGTPAWVAYRAQLEQFNPAPLIACWESLVAADFRTLLPRIDVPTLLIYGGESNFYVPATASYVAQAIPDSQLCIYDGCDHSPHLWQRERFLRDLKAFAAEPLARPSA